MDDGYIKTTPVIAGKLSLLPEAPGCYIMKDGDGNILYIGKAKVLKNRVRSYFQKSSNLTRNKRRMVFQIADFDLIVVNTEREAFILENSLIKKHKPPFNVLLKDDKSYPYITVTMSETWPRIMIRHKLRRQKNDKDRYFGPYTDSAAVRQMIKVIRKVFRVPCGYRDPEKAGKGCMYWHIGQCIGVCAGKAGHSDYMNAVGNAISFLEGKRKDLLSDLKRRMELASENMEYEEAAKTRDQILAIEKLSGDQYIIGDDFKDRDIIAIAVRGEFSCVNIMQIRQNTVIGQSVFELSNADEEAPEDAMREFLCSYYSDQKSVPREIIANLQPGSDLADTLSDYFGSRVNISVPFRGRKKELLLMAEKNAEKELERISAKHFNEELFNTESLAELAECIGMDYLPARMECYDISHIQGSDTVASLVTFTDGVPDKDKYRHFKLRTTEGKPDDFASMKEVISRRLTGSLRSKPEFSSLPDLFIIDGGKGQLSSVVEAFEECGVGDANVISLAKRDEIVYLKDMTPVILSRRSKALMLLQRIRNEAHRFAITHHRSARSKKIRKSTLSEIPGIGPKRQAALIKRYYSVEEIMNADVKSLMAVPGINRLYAQRIYDHFHPELK